MYFKYKVINKLLYRISGIILISWGLYQGYVEFYPHKWQIVTPTNAQVQEYSIKPTKALALYQLMKDTHEILTHNNINYWIIGGTLLGAVRHKGVIPFDDDLDIGVDRKDEIKLQKTFSAFRKLHYQISHKKIYSICGAACLDIFIYHQNGDKFVHSDLEVRDIYPNDYFKVSEIFPLKKYQFGELEVYGPNEYKPSLDRQYPEWAKYAIIQQPHNYHYRLSGIEKKTKFVLTPALLKPAMPTSPLTDRTSSLVYD